LRCNTTTITAASDIRDKTNIQDLPEVLPVINSLHPVSFTWNMRDGGRQGDPDYGFIAQEVDAVQTAHNAEWLNLVDKNNPHRYELSAGRLIPVLVKALQEQQSTINTLKQLIRNASSFEDLQRSLE